MIQNWVPGSFAHTFSPLSTPSPVPQIVQLLQVVPQQLQQLQQLEYIRQQQLQQLQQLVQYVAVQLQVIGQHQGTPVNALSAQGLGQQPYQSIGAGIPTAFATAPLNVM